MNEKFKPSTAWFPQYVGNFIGARVGGAAEAEAYIMARSKADAGFFVSGSPEFNAAKEDIVSRNIGPQGGARFNDKTNLWHYEGMYNFSDLITDVEVIGGASYRLYDLNSEGTIFDDIDRKLSYSEYGAYLQGSRKLLEDKLKLTGSVRYDKNENFEGNFSPRIAGVWTAAKNHYFRLSYQKGFRNPTAQSQYFDLLVQANSRLVGALPEILEKYQLHTNKPYTDESYDAYLASGYTRSDLLETFTFRRLRPEQVNAYEVGYRTLLGGKLSLDACYYFNNYRDFLTNAILWQNPRPGDLAGLRTPDRYSVTVNSEENVKAKGWAIGVDYRLGKLNLTGNISYDKITKLPPDFFDSFNSPAYKFNLGISSVAIQEFFGFNLVYRWQDEFLWRSQFAVGKVPAYGVLDAQVSYRLPAYGAVVKIGSANLLNNYYRTSFGNPAVGGVYYISLVFDSIVK